MPTLSASVRRRPSSRAGPALVLPALLAACPSQPFVVDVPLRVVSTEPSGGAAGVSRTATLRVRFSEPLQSPSVASFRLVDAAPGGSSVPLQFNYPGADALTVELAPKSPLGWARRYVLTLGDGLARARDGAPLATPVRVEFTTEEPPPLRVVATSPGAGATGVGRRPSLWVQFSEPIDCASFTGNPDVRVVETPARTRTDSAPVPRPVAGTWSCTSIAGTKVDQDEKNACAAAGDCKVSFAFAAPGQTPALGRGSTVTLEIPGAARSEQGSVLPDAPDGGMADAGVSSADAGTAASDGGSPDAGAPPRMAIASARAAGSGGKLPVDVRISFTVVEPPPELLVGSSPADGARGVERGAKIVLVFTEPLARDYASNHSVRVEELQDRGQLVEVPGVWSTPPAWNGVDTCAKAELCTATFTPECTPPACSYTSAVTVKLKGLLPGSERTPPLQSAAATLGGGQLPADRSVTFRTEDPPAEELVGSVPTDGAAEVDPASGIVLTFSRPLAADYAASLQVEEERDALAPSRLDASGQPTTVVTGTWSAVPPWHPGDTCAVAGLCTASFVPDAPFAASSLVRVKVRGAAGSGTGPALASAEATSGGGRLAADRVVSFRTWDPSPLVVLMTSPSDQATGVPTDARIAVRFGAPVNCSAPPLAGTFVVEATRPATAAGGAADPAQVVDGSFACNPADTIVFSAAHAFARSTEVRVTLGTASAATSLRAADATSRGGALAGPLSFRFRVEDPPPLLVTAIVPSGAVNVAADAAPRVYFSRPVACRTAFDPLGESRVALRDATAGAAIPIAGATCDNDDGVLGDLGRVLTVTPAAGALEAGHDVTLTVRTGILAADATLVGAQTFGRLEHDVATTLVIGAAPLRVVSTAPADGDAWVPLGGDVRLRFNEAVDPASVTTCVDRNSPEACNVLLVQGTDAASGAAVPLRAVSATDWDAASNALHVAPATPLAAGASYILQIKNTTAGPQADDGASRMQVPFEIDFRAATGVHVLATTPEAGATGVSVSTQPCVEFDDTVDPASLAANLGATQTDRFGRIVPVPLDAATPYLVSDADGRTGNVVCLHPGAATLDGLPGTRALLHDHEIVFTAGAALVVGGQALGAAWSFRFRTAGPLLLRSVSARNDVATVDALDGGTDVPVRLRIDVRLAGTADPGSISGIGLFRGDSSVAVSVAASGDTVRISPAGDLAFGADYRLVLPGGRGGLSDIAGNLLETTTVATFRTGAGPTTAMIGPPDAVLPLLAVVPVVFSRAVFMPSANTATIAAFVNGRDPVPGVVAQSSETRRSVSFHPLPAWPSIASGVLVKVSGVLDERGNPVSDVVSRTWTTAAAVAAERPLPATPALVTPTAGTEVSADQTFILQGPGTGAANRWLPASLAGGTAVLAPAAQTAAGCPTVGAVPLSVVYSPSPSAGTPDAATFAPADPTGTARIRGGCSYVLRIRQQGLANLLGLSAAEGDASIEAVYTGERQRPAVLKRDIQVRRLGGTGGLDTVLSDVVGHTAITAAFSESIDPATVTAQTFVVSGAGAQVPGTLRVAGSTVMFTPSAYLRAGTTYAVLLRANASGLAGIADLAGNALASDVSASFSVETAPPVLGAAGVSRSADGSVRLEFDQAIDPASLRHSTRAPDGSLVPGSLGISVAGSEVFGTLAVDAAAPSVVVFTPADGPLAAGTSIAVSVTTGLRDTAGTAAAAQSVTKTL